LVGFLWVAAVESIRRVGGDVDWDIVLPCTISVVVVNRNMWTVDWELLEIWPAMAIELGVQIGKDTTLKKGVLREVNAADDVTWLELQRY
jgi:hypothetical protein